MGAAAGCSRSGAGTDSATPAAPDTGDTPDTAGPHADHGGSGPSAERRSTVQGGPWSEAASWDGGTVPGADDRVSVAGPILVDADVAVGSVTILPGASLTFDEAASRTLQSRRNVVVQGMLAMRPEQASVVHRLVLTGAEEGLFTGGGMIVVDDDVGVWVMDEGELDIAGTAKLPWARAADALTQGQSSVTLDEDPQGWREGDELVITATLEPTPEEEASHEIDVVQIAGISGRTVTLSAPLAADHPAVDVGRGRTLGAEVLNLTRNVAIEGLPEARSHVFVHSNRPQSVRYAALRHLGPRQPDPEGEREGDMADVLGRYALHFHHCADGSRGSLIEGVVARDLGAHAFVPHESNGTTWRGCIAHDTYDHAYWWDPNENAADVLFERCVASSVGVNAPNSYNNGGFLFGRGPSRSNIVRGCVATNVMGDGFLWYDGDAVWVFEDSVAHNNAGNGIRVWQNNSLPHHLNRFVCYRNDSYGVDHGAYGNSYHYEEGNIVGNASGAVVVRAVSSAGEGGGDGLAFTGLYCDASGTEAAMGLADGSPVQPTGPTVIRGCEFVGATKAGLLWAGSGHDALAQVLDCTFDGNEIWVDTAVGRNTRIELSDSEHGDVVVLARGRDGTAVPAWNAVVGQP